MTLEPIGRALNTLAAVEHVRVDHRGLDVAVAEEFLHGADVVAGLQKMDRERVTKRLAARLLRDPGPNDGPANGALDYGFTEVVPASLAGQMVYVGPCRGKDPLPFLLAAGGTALVECKPVAGRVEEPLGLIESPGSMKLAPWRAYSC